MGERLAALDALLSRVVEQWLSSRTRETQVPGNSASAIKRFNDFPDCANWVCGDAAQDAVSTGSGWRHSTRYCRAWLSSG
jgi:hypothetical protein